MTENKMNTSPTAPTKKKNSAVNWFLWWQISPEELQKQIDGYKTLPIFKTARGISFILIVVSLVITFIFCVTGLMPLTTPEMYGVGIEQAIYLILSLFILRGHKWAMIGAMVLWSIDKAMQLIPGVMPGNMVVVIIMWAVFMHAFFLAYMTEKKRVRVKV